MSAEKTMNGRGTAATNGYDSLTPPPSSASPVSSEVSSSENPSQQPRQAQQQESSLQQQASAAVIAAVSEQQQQAMNLLAAAENSAQQPYSMADIMGLSQQAASLLASPSNLPTIRPFKAYQNPTDFIGQYLPQHLLSPPTLPNISPDLLNQLALSQLPQATQPPPPPTGAPLAVDTAIANGVGSLPDATLALAAAASMPALLNVPISSYLATRKRRHASSTTVAADSSTGSSSSGGAGGERPAVEKKPQPIPEEKKDDAYWERRRKNNDAAKRSRDTRRMKEEQIAMKAAMLESENLKLRAQVAILKNETAKLQLMLYHRV